MLPARPQLIVLSPSLGASSVGPYHTKAVSMATAAASRGVDTTLVLPEGPRPQLPSSINILQVPSVFDHQHIKKALHGMQVAHVLPLREACVETAAELGATLDPSGISPESATRARDKFFMKQAVQEHGLSTADFTHPLSSYDDVSAFVRKYGYPIVLKPRTGFGCLGTKVINNEAELKDAWKEIAHQPQLYIAEAFVNAAAEYHVDLLFRGGEILFSELCRYPQPLLTAAFPGNITCHYGRTPSEEKMIQLGTQTLTALGVQEKTGVAHIEFFLTPDQRILFGEAALRLPGGSIVPLYKAFTGIDLAEAWVLALLDKTYTPQANYHESDIGTELLAAPRTGKVLSTPDLAALARPDGLLDHQIWLRPGDMAERAVGSTGSRWGHFVYANGLPPSALEERRIRIRAAFNDNLRIAEEHI